LGKIPNENRGENVDGKAKKRRGDEPAGKPCRKKKGPQGKKVVKKKKSEIKARNPRKPEEPAATGLTKKKKPREKPLEKGRPWEKGGKKSQVRAKSSPAQPRKTTKKKKENR